MFPKKIIEAPIPWEVLDDGTQDVIRTFQRTDGTFVTMVRPGMFESSQEWATLVAGIIRTIVSAHEFEDDDAAAQEILDELQTKIHSPECKPYGSFIDLDENLQ